MRSTCPSIRDVILATCFRSSATSPGAVITSGTTWVPTVWIRNRSRTAAGGWTTLIDGVLDVTGFSGGSGGFSGPRSLQLASNAANAIAKPRGYPLMRRLIMALLLFPSPHRLRLLQQGLSIHALRI